MIGEVFVLVGSVLALVSAIGMVRWTDVFARMHALSKASTMSVILVLTGAAIALHHPNDVTSLVLATALHIVTSPFAANMVSVATFHTEGPRVEEPVSELEQQAPRHSDGPDDRRR